MPWITLYLVAGAAVWLWTAWLLSGVSDEPTTAESLAVVLFWPLILVSAGIATLAARHNRKAG